MYNDAGNISRTFFYQAVGLLSANIFLNLKIQFCVECYLFSPRVSIDWAAPLLICF